jgi:ERCC4-type nuclease
MIILVDTREKVDLPWPEGVTTERASMGEADYTTPKLQGRAVIERKSGEDFIGSIGSGRERLDDELRRLRDYARKCIVVESDILALYRMTQMHPHAILGTCASFWARSECPVLFAGNRAGAARLIAGILRRWEEVMGDAQEKG